MSARLAVQGPSGVGGSRPRGAGSTQPWRRRWRQAVAPILLLTALALGNPARGQSPALQEAWRRANDLINAGRFAEAEGFARRAVDLAGREAGEDGPQFERSITDLAQALQGEGHYPDAEALYRRSLEIRERALGRDNPKVAPSLYNLAVMLLWEGRHADAEPLFRRALALREQGPEGADLAQSLNGLGNVLQAEGRYKEAEPIQRRALSIREKTLGPEAPEVAENLFNLAALLREEGRFAEAEGAARRSVAIREKVFGPAHPAVAASLNDLGFVLVREGRYAEAEPIYQRALAIDEKARGPQHPDVGATLNNLAVLYARRDRFGDAERAYQRALAIQERALGPQHPDVSATLGNIVLLLSEEGRHEEAEPIARRALAIDERALGPEHPDTATSVDNLASVLQAEGRYGDAETLRRRSLSIREGVFGRDHITISVSLLALALILKDENRYADAEPLYRRAIEIRSKTLGPDAPDTGAAINDLASLYTYEGRYAEAEPLYRRSAAIAEKALGGASPDLATTLANLGAVLAAEHRDAEALPLVRRATEILAASRSQLWGSDKASRARLRKARDMDFNHIVLAARLIAAGHPQARALGEEAFAALQWAKASDTAGAVARMAARFGAGNDALAAIVRAQQDAQTRLEGMRAAILRTEGMPEAERSAEAETKMRADADALEQELHRLDGTVSARFPRYAELADPSPISVAEAEALLAPDEALIVAVVGRDATYLSASTHAGSSLRRVDMGADAIAALVKKLRGRLAAAGPAIPQFPAAAAYELYRQLFKPAESVIQSAKHVIFVGDGALESLPLSVLLTESPAADAVADPAALRELAWFARAHAVSVLPSVSALKALRQSARPSKATKPFLGVGDPLLKHHPPAGERVLARAAAPGPLVRGVFRGGEVDVEELRSLPSLPETAGELEAEAEMLRAPPDSLLLREKATVTAVTKADLTSRRVIAFATHALLGGDGDSGVGEPGLVLTPPAIPSTEDDGLLRASAIALLKLDADLIVLSACNTAASDGTPGADGFSGLAKAFLYGGTRAIVVSHWSVASDATVALMRRMFAASLQPSIGRAEALRLAMLAVMEDPTHTEFAHPFYWGPFVVVGEGGLWASGGGPGGRR